MYLVLRFVSNSTGQHTLDIQRMLLFIIQFKSIVLCSDLAMTVKVFSIYFSTYKQMFCWTRNVNEIQVCLDMFFNETYFKC